MIAALLLIAQIPDSPIEFGRMELNKAAGSQSSRVVLKVAKGAVPESFRIESKKESTVVITGTDQVGAMYGALEFAERIKQDPRQAWKTNFWAKPFLKDRGLNLFLTLPWDYKRNDTDYDPEALVDPNRWWFQNEGYWRSLLDLMARSRLNWLDIHGSWDVSVTNAPNLYAYFVTSATFPKVGVSQRIKDSNLARLNRVVELAHARGIKVSLMAYEANLRIPQNRDPGYEASEANIYTYTREVVEQMIRRCPKLDGIGFRIGESGRGESFFKCYGEAVKRSGRDIPLITRSWITRKQRVLPLARESKDFTVEIKYNGEQWGAPYMVAGGRMANWYSYGYEDYLSDSSLADQPAKMWPGNRSSSGKQWPDQPYKIVWQVRANGTLRIFPFYNPEWVRRTIKEMPIGTASGYTVEGADAYYPKRPDYYLADMKDKYCDWIHQRDEMYWTIWGRLGYDPGTPDTVFDRKAIELLGSRSMVQAWKEASTIVSTAFMAYSLGPDHRDHAPELEWGGDTSAYIQGQPFDSFTFIPINEELANAATGGIDGRVGLYEVAERLRKRAEMLSAVKLSDREAITPRGKEIEASLRSMASLAAYYASRFYGAHSMAIVAAANGSDRRYEKWPIETSIDTAERAFQLLASSPWYRPFTERLRMRTNTFAWTSELEKVKSEALRLKSLSESKEPVAFVRSGAGGGGPDRMSLSQVARRDSLVFEARSQHARQAWLLYKPLPSSTFFHRKAMRREGDHFVADLRQQRFGYAVAAEFKNGDTIWRCPDVLNETPYRIIPSEPGPTPQIYSSEEALAYLNPEILTPEKFGAILIGTRANNFFQRFDNAMRRKLIAPVKKGLKLVILQEDFAKDRLDWLPMPLKFANIAQNTFEPGGQLALPKIDLAGIMFQKFLPSDGWEVFGNGGLARLKLGKGEVWVTSARLMQLMHYPDAAKAFVRMLSLGGKTKPTVLVDSCSEGGPFTSSCHPDLMNSHDIPFMTLGEVIAQVQGIDSFNVIRGPVLASDLLNGRGSEMANAFLKRQVQEWSHRETPATRTEFERLRQFRKHELMRSLGLDPMPPKTPLNAKITGIIPRNGYRIEKLVFESRPNFFVTAHVYVPEGPAVKRPLVVNVNGHWSHKKDEDRLQLPAAFQALRGYIAVTIDSPGFSFEGNSLIERRAEGDHNDYFLVQGGTNTTGYYVWDCIRLLDYMSTRSDVDMSRIGITGASGGGLATLFAFAADDRYRAAVPVVYMSSQEMAPDNGCLCNHVPAVCQIGDRSDVIGIQAPKPILIMGAQNDSEFPPDATLLTHRKVSAAWKLFGKDQDTYVQIFPGGHDYNQPMRERMMGFFDKYLRGVGDGNPVTQPTIETLDPESRTILVMDPPPSGERTMRDLSREYLAKAPTSVNLRDAIAVNGGIPTKTDLKLEERIQPGLGTVIIFEPQPGLKTPGVLMGSKSDIVTIVVDDRGKSVAIDRKDSSAQTLYLDILGIGELSEIELRYSIYLGRSVPFTGGWQIARAIDALKSHGKRFKIQARGPISTQAAMWAALMEPRIASVDASDCLGEWSDVFLPGISPAAIQPRAHLLGSLGHLRSQVKNGTWKLRAGVG